MIRIETIEQLRNSTLMEEVIDRFRRATQPMNFVFFVRCKQLGGPLLIPAPPGRRVKSELVRLLKKGNPAPYTGTMTRHERKLHFHLDRDPSDSTKRKLVQHLARVGSPVPLSDIVFTTGSNETSSSSDQALSVSASIEELKRTAPAEKQSELRKLVELRARANQLQSDLRALGAERSSLLAIADPTVEQAERLKQINAEGPVLRENFEYHKALCQQLVIELQSSS